MTKINKIVFNGFKSFGKRTELVFGNKFNCILGPNGSGKSNVLDGICFVLGKSSSKSLRAEKSANLVYNGGKSKKPSKFGEVSIYFDNSNNIFPTKEKEVKISRVVRQSGQSVYKINDQVRTRQEIIDLLGLARVNPDGYNIILQGDIVKFVEMSSIEKRQVMEEISGISIYEDKKSKAINELEKVEGKLNEADIILKERDAYLKELRKDRDKAIRYKEMNDKLNQNKASLLKIGINTKEAKKKEFDDSIAKYQAQLDNYQKQIDKIKEYIAAKKQDIQAITTQVEEKGEKDQVAIQKQIEQLRVDIARIGERLNSCNNEIVRIKQRRTQLDKNLEEVRGKIDEFEEEKQGNSERKEEVEKELNKIEESIANFKKKNKIDSDSAELERSMEENDKQCEEILKRIQVMREEQQNMLRDKDKKEYQVQTTDERIEKVLEVEKENKSEIINLKKKRDDFKGLTEELNKLLDESSVVASMMNENDAVLKNKREEHHKLSIRDMAAKESVSGNIAVKKILENKNSMFKGVHGTVAELGNSPKEYAVAMEVAAGQRIKGIVCENDAVAAKCIKYLKEKKLGSASFVPMNKIKGPKPTPGLSKLLKMKGVHGKAVDLLTYNKKFTKVFEYVFGDTIIVDDIDTCRKLGIGKARMSTLTGDLTEVSGVMHGGFRKKSASFKVEELGGSISKMAAEIKELEEKLGVFENRKKENDEKILNLREKKALLEGDIIKTEKSLHLDSSDLTASEAFKEKLEKDIEELTTKINEVGDKLVEENRRLTSMKTEKQQLKDKISELKNPRVLAELNAYEAKRQELREQIIKIDSETRGIDTQVGDIFGRDKENILKIKKDLDQEEAKFKAEILELDQEKDSKTKSLEEKEGRQKEFYAKFKALFSKRSKINEDITKFEKNIGGFENKRRENELKINSLSLENAKVKAELVGLLEQFAQYEGVPLNLKKTEEQMKKEISECERLKDQIGSVNMKALEIFESVEKEYKALLEKKDKLMKEKDSVVGLMDEIETKKKDMFMKTFDAINEQFKQIFSQLSTKGQAYLEIEDPVNPFEAGVGFKVRLKGNKFMDIRSLSGGEKTMTAIAFIFAIQEFDPASFYVLDEVDAALDKHNSEKLGKLIGSYAGKAQYIMISHNDHIINEAETLYGVSMNEFGATNVVSLRV